MSALQVFASITSIVSTFILIVLAYRAWQNHSASGKYGFIALMIAVAWWSFIYALQVITTPNEVAFYFHRIKYIGIAIVPVAWLVFAGQYSGRWRDVQFWQIALLSIIPILTIALALTNPLHYLFFNAEPINQYGTFIAIDSDYSIGFNINTLYSYTLVALGVYWLVVTAIRSIHLYQEQVRLLLAAVVIPLVGNALTLTDIPPFGYIDLAPILFTISGLLIDRLLQDNIIDTLPIAYDVIINNARDGILVLDKNNRVIVVNTLISEMLGKSTQDVIGQPLRNIVPRQIVPMLDQYRAVEKTQAELELFGRTFDFVVSPIEQNHSVQGRVVILRDITRRKEVEEALYANERRWRALFENSQDAVVITDRRFFILLANRQTTDLFGYPLVELYDEMNLLNFLKSADQIWLRTHTHELFASGTLPLYEATLIARDGQRLPVEMSMTRVSDTQDDEPHIQMIIRNISARKVAEDALQLRLGQLATLRQVDQRVTQSIHMDDVLQISMDLLMNLTQADAGVIAVDLGEGAQVTSVAGAYTQDIMGFHVHYDVGITGRVMQSRQAENVGNVLNDADYYPDLESTRSMMALPLLSQGRLIGIVTLESNRLDGFTESLFNFTELVVGRVAVALDNARLYEVLRERLNKVTSLNEELTQAEELKTDMIRIANHDIQNPLSVVRGYVSLLKLDSDELSSSHQAYIDEMDTSLQRIDNILRDFLSVEAVKQRASGEMMQLLDLLPLANQIRQEYQLQLEDKDIELTASLPPSDEAIIQGDRAQIYEAMSNLMSNAIKYTPAHGKINMELYITPTLEVAFALHDTGYGIPEDRQQRLFQPFYRTKTQETAMIEGTGLGLHLVKNIVERHQGEMIFRSVYLQGSTFGFKIPLAQRVSVES